MVTHFSWSDSIHAAFSSCLPCLRTTHSETESLAPNDDNVFGNGTRGVRRARPNELEGLLADAGDTDTEAETLSLHSNIGNGDRRRKRKRGSKTITVFGWNLFGGPAIHLPDDDEDDLLARRRSRRKPTATLSSSNSTLDSDAAPLDHAAIENLQISSAQLDERAAAAEAEDKRLKEERRQLRRERKELERAKRTLVLAAGAPSGPEDGFEGFPGSGVGPEDRNIPSPVQGTPLQPPLSGASDGLGRITAFFKGDSANTDPDSDDADLGGQLYARRTTSGNSDGSDSRSRTSASQSNPDQSAQYNHHYLSSQSSQAPPHSARSESFSATNDPLRKTKSSKSKSSTSRSSKSSTSQSPSLPSPVGTSFPASPGIVLPHSNLPLSAPLEEFEGFPIDNSDSGFPSAGIGGIRRKGRDMGAFLADRGTTRV